MQTAIEHGLTILGWFENLMEDEVPPEHLWDDDEGLQEWWKLVKVRREDKYGSGGGSVPDLEDIEQNELAAEFKKMKAD